jgi:branched-chain amino acid transport system ATP-binding protein
MSELTLHFLRKNGDDKGTPLLEIRNLCVRVGIRRILNDLNFAVGEGEVLLITGRNAAGKSSALNAIFGLEPARIESGSIYFDGRDISCLPPHARATAGIAYLRQRENVFADLTVEENLRLALGPVGPENFAKEHAEWAREMPLNRRASILSTGQRQRLAWAMMTMRPARLLMADEPDAGLSQRLPLPANRTLIIVSHSQNWLTPTPS